MQGLSLAVASGGHSSSRCAGLSLSRPLLLRSTGSRRAGSVIVAHGPSCSAACGILPDQGSNPCPLHQQADSQPLRHQGRPPPSSISLSHSHSCSFCIPASLFLFERKLIQRIAIGDFRGQVEVPCRGHFSPSVKWADTFKKRKRAVFLQFFEPVLVGLWERGLRTTALTFPHPHPEKPHQSLNHRSRITNR